MIDRFDETSRKELEYVGANNIGQSEKMSFFMFSNGGEKARGDDNTQLLIPTFSEERKSPATTGYQKGTTASSPSSSVESYTHGFPATRDMHSSIFRPKISPNTDDIQPLDNYDKNGKMIDFKYCRQVSTGLTSRNSCDSIGANASMQSCDVKELITFSQKKSVGITGEIQHQNTMSSENGRKIELTISKSMSMSEKEDEKIVSETKTKPQTIVPSMKAHGPKYLNYEVLLRSKAKLFSEFTFLLTDLKLYVMRYLNSKEVHWDRANRKFEDIVARRRLKCCVLAYGGNMFPRQVKRNSSVSSIFRLNEEKSKVESREQDDYDSQLYQRFYDNDRRLSWDVEDSSPVPTPRTGRFVLNDPDQSKNQQVKNSQNSQHSINNETSGHSKTEDGGTKMKYRCKLCGQPKQNHSCPYEQSLERSIGTMAHSAVNAFQSEEPGKLTSALSEMNNYLDLEDLENGDGFSFERSSQSKRQIDPYSLVQNVGREYMGKRRKIRKNSLKKDGKNVQGDNLFLETMEIKPEQFRAVSLRSNHSMGDFQYPTIPMTNQQRGDSSEELFRLCQQVHGLADECGKVLQVARETKLWDLAVAELTTQVLVVLRCPPRDDTLNGLGRHLLSIGISS